MIVSALILISMILPAIRKKKEQVSWRKGAARPAPTTAIRSARPGSLAGTGLLHSSAAPLDTRALRRFGVGMRCAQRV